MGSSLYQVQFVVGQAVFDVLQKSGSYSLLTKQEMYAAAIYHAKPV